jgi:thiamine-monophosphate kinase
VKLTELGEFAFIDRITPGCERGDPARIVRGIGDDAAVVEVEGGVLVLTTDMLIERVHFLRGTITPWQLGYKALAVNLSDIAAMGAVPHEALISIAIPPTVPVEELDQIYDGMKSLAADARVNLLGGDTTGSKADLCLNIVVTGSGARDEILYRSGARTGDRILVTGTLGDSAAGLVVLLEHPEVSDDVARTLVEAHYVPELYLEEARIMARSGAAHAAIDLSDGLASDLRHICRASGGGAVVDVPSLPLSPALLELCSATGRDPVRLAVAGGEDYRLLVTVDPDRADELGATVAARTGRQLIDVGEIVAGDSIRLRLADGSTTALSLSGWDHFAGEARASGEVNHG